MVEYEGRGELFEHLSIWKEKAYQKLQGTYPVISLTFANVKETDYEGARRRIYQILMDLYRKYDYIRNSERLMDADREYFDRIFLDMSESDATYALYKLSEFLYRYYGKKAIIFLDEYDTPMQEAYVDGYWEKLVAFIRNLFNAAFKTNPYLERGLMTGITRISKESIFLDLNNLKVVTTTSEEYAEVFGFTEKEVFSALDELGFTEKEKVKEWYDGFTFGRIEDIYNPWSILNYLDTGRVAVYWANTSSNSLVGKLIREGNRGTKQAFEALLRGETIWTAIDEQIVYNQLNGNQNATWSLLLASGYLKVVSVDFDAMNEYMNRVTIEIFSFFDTGKKHSEKVEPERFYHGFVLGLMVELRGRYRLTSNRESGFGRYDVMLEPVKIEDPAIIIEFKVFNPKKEESLEDAVKAALKQIEEKDYSASL